MNEATPPRCWVVTDGSRGMEIQAAALAELAGFDPIIKRIRIRAPWRWLPPRLWFRALAALGPGGDRLEPPWPDAMITTGRRSVAPAVAVKRASGGRTFTVHIQSPGVPANWFDLIVVPRHDRLRGPNVIAARGSVHALTAQRLAEARCRFAPRLAALPRPLVAVLVGGDNKVYRLTRERIRALAEGLAALARRYGAGLAVTTSRRTGAENEALLRALLAPLGAEIWDGSGENPYVGYLALADAVVVTADSVNMVSEACATGKPVYVFELEGGSRKFRRFHEEMRRAGLTRPFDGTLAQWSYPPLREAEAVAAAVRERLAAHRAGLAARAAPL